MDDIFYPLHLSEITGVDQDGLPGGRDRFFEMFLIQFSETVEVDEIVNGFDLAGDLEGIVGFLFKKIGNGRNAIGLIDAEFNHR